MRGIAFLLFLMCQMGLLAQTSVDKRLEGDRSYDAKDYESASKSYQEAYDLDPSPWTAYNLGNSLYQMGDYEGAAAQYEISEGSNEDLLRSDAYFNQGNAYFKSQKYAEAVEAYKESLKYNEGDQAAKQNLLRAKQQLKIQQQQQQQQQQQNGDQNDENQDENQDQNDQNQDQNGEGEEDQQSQGQQSEQDKDQEQKGNSSEPIENKDLNKSEAAKLLEIAESEEDKTKAKMHRAQSSDRSIEKDW